MALGCAKFSGGPVAILAICSGLVAVGAITLSDLGLDARQIPLEAKRVNVALSTSGRQSQLPNILSVGESGNNGPFVPFIVNGDRALPGEFKYQAAIIISTANGFFQICGGCIISPHHALTAAHCMQLAEGNRTYDYYVAVGLYDLNLGLANAGSQMTLVTQYKIHHSYGIHQAGYPNDIAMLYLQDTISENQFVQFAQLATIGQSNEFFKTNCRVSGWGYSDDNFPEILHFGRQYIPGHKDCKNFWAVVRRTKISKRHICGYYYPSSPCRGDSGSPLSCGDVVVGLASWGLVGCSGCFPHVYTKISFHHKWIMDAMLEYP